MSAWCLAFGATLLIESLVVLCWAAPGQRRRWLGLVLALNCLTHPLASGCYAEGGLAFWPIEAGVWIVEAGGYALLAGLRWPRALLYSLASNATSAGLASLWFPPPL